MISDPVQFALLYFIMPLWFLAGVADWLCHRASDIEHTTGAKESIIHLLMFAEEYSADVAPPSSEMNSRRFMSFFPNRGVCRPCWDKGRLRASRMQRVSIGRVRVGSNPVLRLFPLHVRSGAASGIPGGTADVAVVPLSDICCKPLGPEPAVAFRVRARVRELDATPSRQTRRVGEMLRFKQHVARRGTRTSGCPAPEASSSLPAGRREAWQPPQMLVWSGYSEAGLKSSSQRRATGVSLDRGGAAGTI